MVTILSYTLKHIYIKQKYKMCRLGGDQLIDDSVVTTDGMLSPFNTVASWQWLFAVAAKNEVTEVRNMVAAVRYVRSRL